MGVAGWVESEIQESLDGAWVHLPGIMEGLGLVFGAAIGLYFVMVILSYMWTGEAAKLPFNDLFKRFFFLALVCTFSMGGDFYIKYVKEPVLSIPDDVARLVTGTEDNTSSAVDAMLEHNTRYASKKYEKVKKLGLWDFDFGVLIDFAITSGIVLGLGTLFVIIALAYLMVAKILINVVLLIGPAFIMFAFFPPTREYFMKWVGQLLNYIFLVVIFTAVFSLLASIINSVSPTDLEKDLGHIQEQKIIGEIVILLFTYLLFIAVIMAVPSLASALTGGVGISPFGQVAQLYSALKNLPLPKFTRNKPGIGKGQMANPSSSSAKSPRRKG